MAAGFDENTYFYDAQLRQYLVQFMAIFAQLEVQIGWLDDKEPRMQKVPIKNASSSRVVASVIANNTQNKMIKLPILTASMVGITMAPERRHGVATISRDTYAPAGGILPNDLNVIERRMPVPYNLNFELGIWASSTEQHHQILEQILPIFDPIVELQTSDDVFDWTRINTCELVSIATEDVPPGSDRRVVSSTLSFDVRAHLSIPANVHRRIIETIKIRIGAVNQASNTSADYISDLNEQGIEYDTAFSMEDFSNFPE